MPNEHAKDYCMLSPCDELQAQFEGILKLSALGIVPGCEVLRNGTFDANLDYWATDGPGVVASWVPSMAQLDITAPDNFYQQLNSKAMAEYLLKWEVQRASSYTGNKFRSLIDGLIIQDGSMPSPDQFHEHQAAFTAQTGAALLQFSTPGSETGRIFLDNIEVLDNRNEVLNGNFASQADFWEKRSETQTGLTFPDHVAQIENLVASAQNIHQQVPLESGVSYELEIQTGTHSEGTAKIVVDSTNKNAFDGDIYNGTVDSNMVSTVEIIPMSDNPWLILWVNGNALNRYVQIKFATIREKLK